MTLNSDRGFRPRCSHITDNKLVESIEHYVTVVKARSGVHGGLNSEVLDGERLVSRTLPMKVMECRAGNLKVESTGTFDVQILVRVAHSNFR